VKKPTGGLLGRALQEVESRTGLTVVKSNEHELLEAISIEYGAQKRMLDLLGWTVLDHFSGREHEVKFESRKMMAKRALTAWLNDPMIGGAVALMNDFVLGRGIPKPRCNDDLVQEKVDEAWDDPDNRRTLTDYEEQVALLTDLSLFSNLLFLIFDEGDDGKVKTSLLDYMTVQDAVTDPENRHRVLWYVTKDVQSTWDFNEDKWKPIDASEATKAKVTYYEHWHNVKDAESEEDRKGKLDKPKDDKVGKGRVYHVRINRTKEMIFGVPEWQRTLRWATAYNDFMKSRVDMMKAAAAFIMERRVQGTPNQVAKLAAKAISRSGPLSGQFPLDPDFDESQLPGYAYGPGRAAGIITANENVKHEALKLDSGAANAQMDASNLRSQFSAATRWPQHYLGAGDQTSLATATSMELPVLKMVETRQEIVEAIYRWFIDRVIERAVDAGQIPEEADEPEQGEEQPLTLEQQLQEAGAEYEEEGRQFVHFGQIASQPGDSRNRYLLVSRDPESMTDYYRVFFETHEQKGQDEKATKRDLGYEFGLPSPLRRMMADLVSNIANIARTFDPNNTNIALSRAMLYIALGEGLEQENAHDLVDKIFPPGYVDPAIAAAQAAQAQMQPQGPNPFSPESSGQPFPPGPDGNAYGAPMNATPPEKVPMQQSLYYTVGRDGEPIAWPLVAPIPLEHASIAELPENVQTETERSKRKLDEDWVEVLDVAQHELAVLTTTNGDVHRGS